MFWSMMTAITRVVPSHIGHRVMSSHRGIPIMIEGSSINIDERAVEIGTAYCSSEKFVYSIHLNASGKFPNHSEPT